MHEDYYHIEKAIKYLSENFQSQPSLDQVAQHVGLSPFYFQRMFKQWAGISPKKFLQYLTAEYIQDQLRQSKGVLAATYDAGLSSSSRLHELMVNVVAVTPKEFKTQQLIIYYGFHHSAFGRCLLAVTDKGICGIHFLDETAEHDDKPPLPLQKDWPFATFIHDQAKTAKYFQQIFGQQRVVLPVVLSGTNFQIQVWKALLQIPSGQLATYEDVANLIGKPKALRAVGTAIGRNHIGYLIPCHRVINKIGIIGNYRWGSDRKKLMVGWEAAQNA